MSAAGEGGLSVEVRWTLQAGIVLAALLLLAGIALTIAHGGANILAPPYRVSLDSLPGQLASGAGPAFILLGVLVLVFTPIARVLVSLLHFARRRDIAFSLITAFVLTVLALSVVVGLSP
ncbi:MAG TPA: DUF1634 domain-containing protein [Thermoplasmata archaeon]|nr:DUF1634 domain-containing protein [Thermoplasmata archaeon]